MRYLFFLLIVTLASCSGTSQVASSTELPILETFSFEPLERSEAEWEKDLDEQAFYVLREKGTERAFTSPFLDNKKEGIYRCAGCQLPLLILRRSLNRVQVGRVFIGLCMPTRLKRKVIPHLVW